MRPSSVALASPSDPAQDSPAVGPPTTQHRTAAGYATGLAEVIEMGRKSVKAAEWVALHFPREPSILSSTALPRISFRRLAALRILPWGASSMWRAATIYFLAQQYPELHQYRRLGVAHLAPILSLKGPLRLAVLRRAERRGWSRRQVEARIKLISRVQQRGEASLDEYLDELEFGTQTGVRLRTGATGSTRPDELFPSERAYFSGNQVSVASLKESSFS